jgi:hypothetical protein
MHCFLLDDRCLATTSQEDVYKMDLMIKHFYGALRTLQDSTDRAIG